MSFITPTAKTLIHNWEGWNFEKLGRPKIEDYEMPVVLKALKFYDEFNKSKKIKNEERKENDNE